MGCAQSKDDVINNAREGSLMDKDGNKLKNSTTQAGGGSSSNEKRTTNSDDKTTTAFVDEDGEMFYDALQSFSVTVSMMSYAPAASMLKRGASFRAPDTMLRSSSDDDDDTESSNNMQQDVAINAAVSSTPVVNTKDGGLATKRDSVAIVTEKLQHRSGKPADEIAASMTAHGYPGQLTPSELEACLEFRKLLKEHDRPELKEMVAAYHPQEDEAFAICRFLRSRDFDPDQVLQMLTDQNAADIWAEAKSQNFYADFQQLYGCPVPIFMTLFPVVVTGLAKNGATVFYFKSGNMDIDAIECIADLPELVPAVWDLLHNKGRMSMEREAKTHDQSHITILCERIIIVDMKNYPSALFSSRGVEWMKSSAACTACFPETMNRTYMVNVPRTFSIVWALVKIFLEARTLAKIGFFANADRATQDLERFVELNELLSDYGGKGPSYDDVLAAQQKELGEGCTRFVVEHVIVTRKESHLIFTVNADETIDSLVVYSKSDYDAEFTLIQESTGTKVFEGVKVSRDTKTGQGKSNHYSVTLPVNFPSSSTIEGDYKIVAHGSHSKDHFLVTVSLRPR